MSTLLKLEHYGALPVPISFDTLQEHLRALETSTGHLPADYRAFLCHFGATIVFKENVLFKALQPSPWADDNGYDSLSSLYGLSQSGNEESVFGAAETYRQDTGSQWLAIGASSGDNQICLRLQGALSGQVWYWDHESDPVYGDDVVISGMTKIADSFEAFIMLLEAQAPQADASGVVSVDLDF
ncbi:SMI1/KNR4 family protein [Kosakonia sp. BK9b]